MKIRGRSLPDLGVEVAQRTRLRLIRLALERLAPSRAELPGEVPVFFVVGRPRSGTTWLMNVLNNHPEILCTGEGRFFGRNWRIPELLSQDVERQASSLYNAVADNEYLRVWMERSVWSRDEDPEEHAANLTRLATNYFLTRKLEKSGKRMVGDKTPLLAGGIVREISEVYPEARVLHIIRDGRDAAVSELHFLWNYADDPHNDVTITDEERATRDVYREDPEAFARSGRSLFEEDRLRRMARRWAATVGRTVEDGPGSLGDRYAEVRYEDLLGDPQREVGRILRFLGARSDAGTVRRSVETASFRRRSGGRAPGQEDSASGVRKGVSGDWRGVFTERDREVFKEEAGDLLLRLGYEKDGDW